MKMMLGKIISIEEITDMETRPVGGHTDTARIGLVQSFNFLRGRSSMDGYVVTTDITKVYVLIDNGQNCCERWGYFSSNEDLEYFVGAELLAVNLTDVSRNTKVIELSGYYEDNGDIQFVNFETSRGTFQLAVYNAHNGWYGHGIAVVIGDDVIHEGTL